MTSPIEHCSAPSAAGRWLARPLAARLIDGARRWSRRKAGPSSRSSAERSNDTSIVCCCSAAALKWHSSVASLRPSSQSNQASSLPASPVTALRTHVDRWSKRVSLMDEEDESEKGWDVKESVPPLGRVCDCEGAVDSGGEHLVRR